MTPQEFQKNAKKHLDEESLKLYKCFLERIQNKLQNYPPRSVPKSLEIEFIHQFDKEYQKEALEEACKKLINHFKSLNWNAKISADPDFLHLFKTPPHTLHLTYSENPLVKFWYKISGDY